MAKLTDLQRSILHVIRGHRTGSETMTVLAELIAFIARSGWRWWGHYRPDRESRHETE